MPAPTNRIADDIKKTQQIMQKAGEIVLDGFKLRTDVYQVTYPDRYMDARGVKMWDKVMKLLDDVSTLDKLNKNKMVKNNHVPDKFNRVVDKSGTPAPITI